jgi:hypothetical protein
MPLSVGPAVRPQPRAFRYCFQRLRDPLRQADRMSPKSKIGTKKQNFGPSNHLSNS